MLFNSIDFAIFLPIVFILYWFVANKSLKLQNLLIVAASFVFYGWWDWRFLFLIAFSMVVDFMIGLKLEHESQTMRRKILLWTSIAINLGFLGFFKYYDFFLDNFVAAFSLFGTPINPSSLKIILPMGISFYTFQTLSYTIDVYKRELKPTKSFISFAAFVSFFPQLVAGPIERASNLLPQFFEQRSFDYSKAVDGMRQVLWGLFKKIVIADNCALIANEIFDNAGTYPGSTLMLGAVFFGFQIYGDFSGYSDIAIGISRLFGFNLKQNFAFPYFSRDIAEFWRRWHISLTSWFKDYLYIPLGGSRGGTAKKIRNTFIIFLVSGFWHGASWTFIIWGLLNALFFLPLMLLKKNRANTNIVAEGKLLPSVKELFQMGATFALTSLAWIFFRAKTVGEAFSYLGGIFSPSVFQFPVIDVSKLYALQVVVVIVFFLCVEWHGRASQFALEKLGLNWNKYVRRGFYFGISLLIFMFLGQEQQFIYFQF